MKRKELTFLLAFMTASAILFTGCGKGADNATNNASDKSADANKNDETNDSAEADKDNAQKNGQVEGKSGDPDSEDSKSSGSGEESGTDSGALGEGENADSEADGGEGNGTGKAEITKAEPISETEKESLLDKVTTKMGVSPEEERYYIFDDFDLDGKYEGFVYVGSEAEFEYDGYDGTVCFVNGDGCEELGSTWFHMYEDGLFCTIDCENRTFVVFSEQYTTQLVSHVYYVEDSTPRESCISGLGSVVTPVEGNDLEISFSIYDGTFSYEKGKEDEGIWIGHTWKPYYFYYDKNARDFREYVGTIITEEELKDIVGYDLAAEIRDGGFEIGEIFKRDNGIININYSKTEEILDNTVDEVHSNATYNVNTGAFADAWGTGKNTWEDSNYGGSYVDGICPASAYSSGTEAGEQSERVSLATEDDIISFIAGEWKFLNQTTGEDFATLKFEDDGSCTFTRLEDKESCKGKITIKKSDKEGENPDSFELELFDIGNLMPGEEVAYEATNSVTGGVFHIGSGAGRDYLYLTETGNGDTWISIHIFNTESPDALTSWSTDWLFYRENNQNTGFSADTNQEFYAFGWGRGKAGSVLLQKMYAKEFKTFDEYTDRAFRGAYFEEAEDISVKEYELSNTADISGILHEDRFNKYPLYVYSVKTDSDGKISKIEEVDKVYYGMYDLGNLEPEFSTDGNTFFYNNCSFKVQDIAPAATAIMSCEKAGDFIVVECHVNPHYGVYAFFNIYTGSFDYDIMGANLKWKNDDLSTAVYSVYNEVYDFWGNLIGSVQEGEVYDLTFKGNDKVAAECWEVKDGEEKNFTEEFEYEPVDHEMFTYYRYLLSGQESVWRDFAKEAPEGAAAFVMVNAPNMIYDRMRRPDILDEGSSDTVAVVPMKSGSTVSVVSGEASEEGSGKVLGEYKDTHKGEGMQIAVTVPEGMPVKDLVIKDSRNKKAIWPIAQITGRTPQRSTFVVSK